MGYYELSGSAGHADVVFFSKLVSLLIRRRLADRTGGPRAIRGEGATKLDLREERFETDGILLEAYRRNRLRVMEVPCSMLKRAEGRARNPRSCGTPWGHVGHSQNVAARKAGPPGS